MYQVRKDLPTPSLTDMPSPLVLNSSFITAPTTKRYNPRWQSLCFSHLYTLSITDNFVNPYSSGTSCPKLHQHPNLEVYEDFSYPPYKIQ